MVNLIYKNSASQINNLKYYNKVTCALSEPVSYHVKQKLTRVLSVFHATPVSVPIRDS